MLTTRSDGRPKNSDKEQPQHIGNAKFPRLASPLNIANEFARLKQRHTDKLQLIDWEEFDAECKDLYETLKWRYGDDPQPSWA